MCPPPGVEKVPCRHPPLGVEEPHLKFTLVCHWTNQAGRLQAACAGTLLKIVRVSLVAVQCFDAELLQPLHVEDRAADSVARTGNRHWGGQSVFRHVFKYLNLEISKVSGLKEVRLGAALL